MPDPQGYATFPGIEKIISARYTLAHGITPGVCEIECAPQPRPVAEGGTLSFFFGSVRLDFPNCRANLASARYDSRGLVWSIQVLDARWKWAFGELYGEYNRVDGKGKFIGASEKRPQELAALCLQAMGVRRFNVSALPNDARPHVAWAGTNPAQALADLAESLGCVVVPTLANSVLVARLGAGRLLPDLASITEQSLSVDPPERPDTIRVIGAPTRVQARLRLQAVGMNPDGRILPINELSYKPSAGWGKETDLFSSVRTDNTPGRDEARKLCLATVFRWYRPRLDTGEYAKSIPIAGIGSVTSLDQILPIADELLETFEDDDGQTRRKRGRITGTYWIGNIGNPTNSSTSSHWQYRGDYRLIEDLGIVEFPQPVRQWSTTQWAEATLYFDCTFSVRHNLTGAWHRYYYDLQANGPRFGTGPEIVPREDELRLEVYESSISNASGSSKWDYWTPKADLDQQGLYYAQGASLKYETVGADDATYAGLVPISPDGAIREVGWQVGLNGCFTQASRNSETIPYLPTYNQRRMFEKIRGRLFESDPHARSGRRFVRKLAKGEAW